MTDWLTTEQGGASSIRLHIQPGAKKTELAGRYGDALKIRLAAPPVDGKANAELLRNLAVWLSLPKTALTLKSGQTSRRKTVRVKGATPEQIRSALNAEDAEEGAASSALS